MYLFDCLLSQYFLYYDFDRTPESGDEMNIIQIEFFILIPKLIFTNNIALFCGALSIVYMAVDKK